MNALKDGNVNPELKKETEQLIRINNKLIVHIKLRKALRAKHT